MQIQAKNFPVAILGVGTMGEGIAQTLASAGHPVFLYDISEMKIREAVEKISGRLEKSVIKGKISNFKRDQILKNLLPVKNFSDLSKAKLVIEAIIEDLDTKQNVFSKIESLISDDVILATNTSSIDLNNICMVLKYPQRFLGIHFFNPAPIMSLVEVVSTRQTDQFVVEMVFNLAKKWGKIPVNVFSSPGFIVNRAARPFYCEALLILKENVTDCVTCDSIIKECGGFKMGPFELMDLIGLDVNYEVTRQMWESYGFHSRFKPSVLQRNLVEKGFLGIKSGKGFYDYGENSENSSVKNENKTEAPSSLIVEGPECFPESLRKLIESSPVKKVITKGEGYIRLPTGAIVAISNGKSSYERCSEIGQKFISLDLCLDFEKSKRVVLAPYPDCPNKSLREAVGFFQSVGKQVSVIKDIAGMVLTRTVAMLVNEASLLVQEEIADVEGVNLAMKKGLNYPLGPFEWVEKWGLISVVETLDNLFQLYGKRYQKSLWLQQKVQNN